jgi:hypothetical protein
MVELPNPHLSHVQAPEQLFRRCTARVRVVRTDRPDEAPVRESLIGFRNI